MMDANCGLQNAECGLERRCKSRDVALRPSIGNPQSPIRNHRSAFTLIELLVTMVIIAIISAAILGTAASAFENARRSRTQALVTKISGLILERWDSYAERRADVSQQIIEAIDFKYQSKDITGIQRGQMLADARLLARRELMKFEMPDRWSDVANATVPTTATAPNVPYILASPPPSLSTVYFRHMQEVKDHDEFLTNQQAECLYLTVMYATGDGEARSLFNSQDIGDVDGDGAPEFIDGWGQPIRWLRWAAGFTPHSPLLTGDAEGDHDPFDVWKRDSPTAPYPMPSTQQKYPPELWFHVDKIIQRNRAAVNSNRPELLAYRIIPLVYSLGPDGESDVVIGEEGKLDEPVGLDPYAVNELDDFQLGETFPDGDAWRDNITNHINDY
jgi:prepilin-type N-terminal cleavage/methylation domain-containing protein